jgi:hypothetical protein
MVVLVGETVILEVVNPVLHLYTGVPPVEVTFKIVLLPLQMESGKALTVDKTSGITFIKAVLLSTQNLFEPITFRVESFVRVIVIELVVAPLLQL